MEGYGVDSTEMTFDSCKVLIVDDVVKLHVKTTLLLTCYCYILCILAAAQQDMELLVILRLVQGTNRAISAGETIKLMASNLIKGLWVKQLGSAITAACVEHREIVRNFDFENLVLVNVSSKSDSFLIQIVHDETSSVSAVVNNLVKCSPFGSIDLVVFWCFDSLQGGHEGAILSHSIRHDLLHVVNFKVTLLSIGIYHYQHLIIVGELNFLELDNTSLDLQFGFLISIRCVENFNTLRDCCCDQVLGILSDVN